MIAASPATSESSGAGVVAVDGKLRTRSKSSSGCPSSRYPDTPSPEGDSLLSVDNLVDLYFTSVGRNSKLLLNVPPTRSGLLHDTDVARLAGMRARLNALFADDLSRGRNWSWQTNAERGAVAEVDLGRAVMIGIVDLRKSLKELRSGVPGVDLFEDQAK